MDEYEHPLWKEYRKEGIREGHAGIDYLVLRAFFESVINNTPTPIDVYDTATWMAITCLSEESIAMGSMPVAIPDFTCGKWISRKDEYPSKYGLSKVLYVSHPVRSLAQAYVYYNQCTPFGIYVNDKMIGYVMVIYDYDVPEYDVWHMMIDEKHQGNGYGKAGILKVIEYIQTKPFGESNRISLTCNKDNIIALKMYEEVGFQITGNSDDDDEIELVKYL